MALFLMSGQCNAIKTERWEAVLGNAGYIALRSSFDGERAKLFVADNGLGNLSEISGRALAICHLTLRGGALRLA